MRAKFLNWWNPSSTDAVQGFVPGETYDFTAEQIDALVDGYDVAIMDFQRGIDKKAQERHLCIDKKGGRFRQR